MKGKERRVRLSTDVDPGFKSKFEDLGRDLGMTARELVVAGTSLCKICKQPGTNIEIRVTDKEGNETIYRLVSPQTDLRVCEDGKTVVYKVL